MMGYFNPLRRKIGVVVLLLACVFGAAWVRSLDRFDDITINRICYVIISSYCNSLRIVVGPSAQEGGGFDWWSERYTDRDSQAFDEPPGSSISDRIRQSFKFEWTHILLVEFPYWFLVVPLTLLSAWLLLSKTREGKPDINR